MVYPKPRITVGFVIRRMWPFTIPVAAWFVGDYFDEQYRKRFVRFRDKSALYGRKLEEGESPSW